MPQDKQQLLQKIDELIKKFSDPAFPEDLTTIQEWKESVIRAMLSENLKEHEGIKLILTRIDADLEEIDFILLNAPSLEKQERDIILTKKKEKEYFRDLLDPQVESMNEIENQVDKNLNEPNQ